MPDHCNAYDAPFYVTLKSSLKVKRAVAGEQQHSGSLRAAREQQARSGGSAAEGGLGAAALRAVGSPLGVSLPAGSSSPGKAKGEEAMSQRSSQVSPINPVSQGTLWGCLASTPMTLYLR